MKFNKWTMGLAAVGVVSLASAARADEKLSQVQTALSNTTLSGYVDTAATFNPGGISSGYAFAKANGFSLNSIDIALDKPMDESPWASGYHVELMFGPDATPASISGMGGNGLANLSSLPIRQGYITMRTPIANSGIDWKMGVFDSILGYESTTDGANPNYTRSFGYTIEPTTFTGLLGTYKVNDAISFSAGMVDTVYSAGYNGINSQAYNPSLVGSFTLTAPDSWGWAKGGTFSFGAVNSPSQSGAGATSWYAGVTVPTPLSALKVGASWDLLDLHNEGPGNSLGDDIIDYALYANYQVNDKLSFNLRGEYLDQSNLGGSSRYIAIPIAKEAEELTATVQYALWANVLSRAEIRWDHAEHGTPFLTSGGNMGTSDAFTFALNLIYQF
jgi:hypothetical protein